MDHIKQGYTSGSDGDTVIPIGPSPDFDAPHDRDRLARDPPLAVGE